MVEIGQEMLSLIESDFSRYADDFERASRYIREASVDFSKGQLQCLSVPKMFTADAFLSIEKNMKVMAEILEKVMDRYLDDPKYRKLFPFSKQMEELILLPTGYARKLPIARLDMFFDEEDFSFKFCEFNADGASAMNEDRVIAEAWRDSALWAEFNKTYRLRSMELFDSWVREFMDIYDTYVAKVEHPCVAIADFLEIGTKGEFQVFQKAFERAGIQAVIADLRDLTYRDDALWDRCGNRIDAVYRRAVTFECVDRIGQIGDFIKAVRAQKVCVIGGFKTQIIHDKNIFRILKMPQTQAFLTSVQNAFIAEHIPQTFTLRSPDTSLELFWKEKDRWVLKPADRYGSQSVTAGADCSDAQWRMLLQEACGQDFIVQEYCQPYRTENISFGQDGSPERASYHNLIGVFLYGGKVAGLYTRCMQRRITTTRHQGKVVCSLIVEEK